MLQLCYRLVTGEKQKVTNGYKSDDTLFWPIRQGFSGFSVIFDNHMLEKFYILWFGKGKWDQMTAGF